MRVPATCACVAAMHVPMQLLYAYPCSCHTCARAVAIGSIEAMQPDDAEIAVGSKLGAAGCKAIVVKAACVGDAEDLPYAKFAIKQVRGPSHAAQRTHPTFAQGGHAPALNGDCANLALPCDSPADAIASSV